MKRPPATTPRPMCISCGKPLRRAKEHVEASRTGIDGAPASWGDYGDNVLCGVTCGYRYALRIARALHAKGALR